MSELEKYLESQIAKVSEEYARFADQKLTFDNLHFISKSIDLAFPGDDQWFTTTDLRKTETLEHVVTRLYGKPSLDDEKAANEYDKFLGQIMSSMTVAGILARKRLGRGHQYHVSDRETLRLASRSEVDALDVLTEYLEAYFKVNGWWHNLELYFSSNQSQSDYKKLKSDFLFFGIEKLKLGSKGSKNPGIEAGRIFSKVLNPLALKYGAFGSQRGRVMISVPSRFDLEYNRPNFRDLANKKPKNLTRKAYLADMNQQAESLPPQKEMTSVMKSVRDYHNGLPEIPDATGQRATNVHHMFPKSEFPEIRDTPENLIALTPGQHFGEAHPNGNTSTIDEIYQRTCLNQKLASVLRSESEDDGMYSLERFAHILEVGFGIDQVLPTPKACREAIAAGKNYSNC
ncbi:hypothetical protein NLL38_02535 [Corynebacterium accolens]|uniref:hypothetical protein n=1 Tax=Corynebacterium accolens TaxID=38284 RepID=UPI00266EED27|nr:hypothetical protein [Corynebacterium accolens]WKS69532.1 hypothetical protein NLL40_02535 [Corynebacterium accolens]WKS71808.1 hypothetical protein NLL38_02535 [Corynebacterium accolens]WKS73771.1 hypothetical protein NLL44_00855 [Corynebacterium accolens]